MKKLLLAVPFLFLHIGFAFSENPGPGVVTKQAARLSANYEMESVYQSSQTCVAADLQSVWISSPYPVNLFAVNVTSAGFGTSIIEVYDGLPTTGTARLVSRIDGRTNRDHLFNVAFSSWLGVSNISISGTPACIDIIYRVR